MHGRTDGWTVDGLIDICLLQEGLGIQIGRPGAGAPNKDKDGNLRLRKAQTLAKTQTGRKYLQ